MLTRAMTVLALLTLAACGPAGDENMPTSNEQAEPAAAAPATPAAEPAPALTRTPAPEGARVYFIAPANGATVSSPVHVVFGLSGAGVAPAGVEHAGTGHHHLLIDTGLPPLDQPIPSDDRHRHFGGGQTEADIDLSPGTHTLQLLLADYRHVPHEPAIASERITITVE